MPGSHVTLPACAFGTAHGSPPVPTEGPMRKACTAEDCRVHSACAGSERSQHRRGDDGGREGDARFVVAALDWSPRQACEPLDMLARMNTSLCIRHGRHARLMCSQAAARQWSSYTMDFYGCTSRGQLDLLVVQTVVQWFASLCCMYRPRAIARSTSRNACVARVIRG
jgi:hypothetical protein